MYAGLDSSLWSGKQDRLTGSACPWIERIGSMEPGKLVITKLIIVIELGHFGETRGCHFDSKFANSPISLKRTNGPGWTNYYFKVRSNLPWEAFVTLLNCFTIPWNDAEFQIFNPWSSCECVACSSEQLGPPLFDNSGAVNEAHAKKWNEGNFDQQSNINLLKSLEASRD